jgi:serine protease AprX
MTVGLPRLIGIKSKKIPQAPRTEGFSINKAREDGMFAARRIACTLLILLILGSIGSRAVESGFKRARNLQPQLAQLATQEPDRIVSVIIQPGDTLHARAAIESLGGEITRELDIIHAVVAEIRAGAAPSLAANPGVRWVSLNSPVTSSGVYTYGKEQDSRRDGGGRPNRDPSDEAGSPIDLDRLGNSFNRAVRAADLWNEGPDYIQGKGVTVAVIDSGSFRTSAIGNRLIERLNFNGDGGSPDDRYGHGTFLTALIASDGSDSAGKYVGIAPRADVISLRISDDTGRSSEADVVSAMQWVYQNRAAYNIRVVNLSLNSSVMQSYHYSPLCAAAEVLWASGILVIAAAGNSGISGLYPPGNDPFVITVGAVDDQGTPGLEDDRMASFSAFGSSELNTIKPELVAPGVDLIAYLPDHRSLAIGLEHADNRVSEDYFRMSGTSVAAALVSGAAALLLESNPQLTPDQVKYRLMASANQSWGDYSPERTGAGTLDVYAAVKSSTFESANQGQLASQLLWDGSDPLVWGDGAWRSHNWEGSAWESVAWGSVSWGSVAWGSVAWGSDYWGE